MQDSPSGKDHSAIVNKNRNYKQALLYQIGPGKAHYLEAKQA